MKGDKIPDSDHITRLCMPKCVDEQGNIQASAFRLRRSEEESLSVNWVEFLDCPSREKIQRIRETLRAKLTIGTKAKIALLNVGETYQKVLTESEDRRSLEILHDPSPIDPCHSGIYNMRYTDDIMISELILETVLNTYPAV
jgi:hypothetical protein